APNGKAPIVGYAGFWMMTDEAHISTIASHPDWRRRGIGELLLLAMIEAAAEQNARVLTLEVRVSNQDAQVLYRKHGFNIVGERKHYYSDNQEDALIMTTPHITTAEYQLNMGRLVLYKDAWLVCQEKDCGRKYPIKNDIPIMLIEEGDKYVQMPVERLIAPV
ncbi:MAG: ribosomal protein S18-alanine N-acetyltransferase, partial [Chloroflexi bacterium]|nr:ribosomal protein S18-alanine N-acetyltransferase [Chloroflexota bacterium]